MSASGQSAAMRTATSVATAAHTTGVRNARGEIKTRAAAARIAGRTNQGPMGRSRSTIAVSRREISRWGGHAAARNHATRNRAIIYGTSYTNARNVRSDAASVTGSNAVCQTVRRTVVTGRS